MTKGKILCVSFDRLVSDSRCEALKEAGYDVTGTMKIEEAIELLWVEKFDLVVVGHRFPKAGREALSKLAHQAETPVVLVCGARADIEIPAEMRVYALQGAEGIVSAATKVLASRRAA